MKLESLHVERAPGLPGGLPTLEFGPGLTIVLGPNASGKSTLSRTVHAFLWPDDTPLAANTRVHSRWNLENQTLTGDIVAQQVTWSPAPPTGILPGAASLARFDIRSLLAPQDAGDLRLARQVSRELAGGLDLDAAAKGFDTSATLASHRLLKNHLAQAQQALQEANRRAASLFQKESQLAGLDEEIEAAKRSGQELEAARRLSELVVARESLLDLEAQVRAFAPGLDALMGDEGERIAELTAELGAKRGQLEKLAAELAELDAARQALVFAEAAPGKHDLDAWSAQLDKLSELERQAQAHRGDLAAAELAASGARALIVTEGHADGLTRASLDQLTESLRAVQETRAEAHAKREAATLWSTWATGEDEDEEALQAAIRALRKYLRLPQTVLGASGPRWLSLALVMPGALAFLLGLGAFAQDFSSSLLAGALIVLGLGALALGIWMRRAATGTQAEDARGSVRAEVERLGLAPPTWSPDAVESHLSQLEKRRAHGEQGRRASDQAVVAGQALELAETKTTRLESDLLDVAAKAGISNEFLGLGMAQEVHALFRWRKAESESMRVRAKLTEAEHALEQGLGECADWLLTFEYAAPGNVREARARIRAVEQRVSDLDRTNAKLAETRREHARLQVSIAQSEGDLAKSWARTGVPVGDLAKLAQRLEAFEAWSELQVPLREASIRLEVARERFAGLERGNSLRHLAGREPESVPLMEVESWVEELERRAAQHGELNQQRGSIVTELELATLDHQLADALALARGAEESVAAKRQEAAEDALARLLLEEAGSQLQSGSGSKLIADVQERFGAFTQHGWSLELDGGGEFCARDRTTLELRSLEELSDGTRIQLLLAARLTALEELEARGPLPICLDEALSTSDPVRFRAIAKALFDEADAGRQILYFTAGPSEAESWKQAAAAHGHAAPAILDLGRLQNAGADWGGQVAALPRLPDPIPEPGNKAHDEYARELGVPLPSGHMGPSAWHLYFVAYEDLAPLATCLRQRIGTLGQWRAVRAAHALPAGFDEGVAVRFDARAHLCETIAGLWSEGRGRPVTWDDVVASGAVSAEYSDRVRALIVEHSVRSRDFMDAVRALKSFRANKGDKLEAHLEKIGCLALDEPLAPNELVRRALGSAGPLAALGGTESAAAYCDWLVQLLGD